MDFDSNDDAVNMDDHVFDEDYEDDADEKDDNEFGKDAQLCLSNIFSLGWTKIDKSKVKEVQQRTRERCTRKQDVTKYIMKQVMDMKSKTNTMVVCSKSQSAEVLLWSCYLHELQPNYY
jgi:hypothetical protein